MMDRWPQIGDIIDYQHTGNGVTYRWEVAEVQEPDSDIFLTFGVKAKIDDISYWSIVWEDLQHMTLIHHIIEDIMT